MEVKIKLSDGFEYIEKSESSNGNFVSIYFTEKELETYKMLKNASEWIRAVSRTTDINMMRLSYIMTHALMCAYRQDFTSMIIGSLRGTVKNARIKIVRGDGTVDMEAFVDALSTAYFSPGKSMNDYIFFSNEKLISAGGISCGYMCMDFFMNAADVSYKLNIIQQYQEDKNIMLLIREQNPENIRKRLLKMKELVYKIKDSISKIGVNGRLKRLEDILGFGVSQGEEDSDTEIFLLLQNNSGSILSNDVNSSLKEIDLSNIILLDDIKFREKYSDYISNNILDYESASDICNEDGDSIGLEIMSLNDVDLILFELLITCMDLCFARECKTLTVIDLDRYFVNAVEDIDIELATLLPIFNDFVKETTELGTVVYVGVKEGSKTEEALKLYSRKQK